jgi:D-alanyl-D-alanine carboxypeptidase/D-alanyl-D-alanine-endopeptidase (penicillin-binding protein 4)
VLAAATPGPKPRKAEVAEAVDGLSRTGVTENFGGSVVDVGTGKVLYDHRAGRAYTPASTMKLLTAAAALAALGPERRFATTVVRAPGPKRGRPQITLVGGGDPYLAAKQQSNGASIADLAAATAAKLKATKQTKVNLRYDASLFSGPAWHPSWPAGYRGVVTPVSALWVNKGYANGGSSGPRVRDPAAQAAQAFAAALRREGLAVAEVESGRAPADASPVATVRSRPLQQIVDYLLKTSDNEAAEVVFRHVGLAGGEPGSFRGARTALKERLRSLEVWDGAARVSDGSGLSRETRLPAEMMTELLRLAMTDRQPALRSVVSGLPVAGVEGSLRSRFRDEQSRSGRGLVRAKTGTLRRVHALAGYVRSVDGSLLVYAFVVNDPASDTQTRIWLDRVTAALSQCGCR